MSLEERKYLAGQLLEEANSHIEDMLDIDTPCNGASEDYNIDQFNRLFLASVLVLPQQPQMQQEELEITFH